MDRAGDVSVGHEVKACQKGRAGTDETPARPTKRARWTGFRVICFPQYRRERLKEGEPKTSKNKKCYLYNVVLMLIHIIKSLFVTNPLFVKFSSRKIGTNPNIQQPGAADL